MLVLATSQSQCAGAGAAALTISGRALTFTVLPHTHSPFNPRSARTLHRDLDSERSVSRGLLDNLGKLKEENEKRKSETDGLQAQIKDLNEQLQDLMFTLSAQAQLAQSEAAGGDLVIGQSSTPTKSPASARRKKR